MKINLYKMNKIPLKKMVFNNNFDGTIESYFNDCCNNIDDSEGDDTSFLYKNYIEYCILNDKKILFNSQNKFTSYIKQNFDINIRSNKTRVNNTYLLRDTDKTLPTTPIKQQTPKIKPQNDNFSTKINEIYNQETEMPFNKNCIFDNNQVIIENNPRIKTIEELVGKNNFKWSLGVKAQMGMGKTEELFSYIKTNKIEKVLLVSFRKSLVAKQFNDLKKEGFLMYNDERFESGKIIGVQKMIVQIDSLHRIYGHYDLLVLDEVRSITEQLVINTKSTTKMSCISALIERVKHTPMLYIADALLNENDVEFFNKCNRSFLIYNNTFKKHEGKKMSFIEDKNIMLNKMIEDIENNKKFILTSGSKEYAISVYETLSSLYEDLKIKLYTGGSQKYTTDPTEEWDQFDVIIYTSTISAGNSFVKTHFDNIYGYYPVISNSVDIALQMLFRCRIFENLFICIETRGDKQLLDADNLEEVRQLLIKKDKLAHKDLKIYAEEVFNIKSSVINNELDTTDPYFYLYSGVINRINLGKKYYLQYLITNLKSMGVELSNIYDNSHLSIQEQEKVSIIQENLKAKKTEHEEIRLNKIVEAPNITKDEYNKLQDKLMKDNLNEEEFNSCNKYIIKQHYKITAETITPDFILMDETYRRKLDRINNIINNFNDCDENPIQNIADNLNKHLENPFYKYEVFNEVEVKTSYKDLSGRLKQTDRLFNTQKIFKLYNILYSLLNNSLQHSQETENIQNTIYNEIFYDESPKLYNFNMSAVIMEIYDRIKPYSYLKGLPKRINEDYSEEGQKLYGKFKLKVLKWINKTSDELLGITLKNVGKTNEGRKNYLINRDYTLIKIGTTNFNYAIHTDFKDKITFNPTYIERCQIVEQSKNIVDDKIDLSNQPTFYGIEVK